MDDLLAELQAEYDRLDAILASLTEAQWMSASGVPPWTIRDVMVHLAQTEEGVSNTIAAATLRFNDRDGTLDDEVAAMVAEDNSSPAEVHAWWRTASAASIRSLAAADPDRHVAWAATPLRPKTLATTRLAEHWAHGLDVTEPLGIEFPDTDRLRHIAWLGHATIPYGCSLVGVEPQPVRAELVAPDGSSWVYGPSDAASVIVGSASDFCRVGAMRMTPAESDLTARGPFAEQALSVLRNYAA